jgi:hypothetical protein
MSLKNELFSDKDATYKKVASDLNGNFSHGGFDNPVRVNIPFRNWIITADTFVSIDLINPSRGNPYGGNSEHTRIRAPFLKTGDFGFAITSATAFDSFAKWLGSQDISTGDKAFDKRFVIKGTDLIKVKLLFSNPSIRKLLSEIGDVNLVLRDQEGYLGTHLPENVSELFFRADDVIFDEGKLKLLIQLFTELLDELFKIGCAKEDAPDFKLI